MNFTPELKTEIERRILAGEPVRKIEQELRKTSRQGRNEIRRIRRAMVADGRLPEPKLSAKVYAQVETKLLQGCTIREVRSALGVHRAPVEEVRKKLVNRGLLMPRGWRKMGLEKVDAKLARKLAAFAISGPLDSDKPKVRIGPPPTLEPRQEPPRLFFPVTKRMLMSGGGRVMGRL